MIFLILSISLDFSFLRVTVGGKQGAQSVGFRLMLVFSVMAEEESGKKGKEMVDIRAIATIFDEILKHRFFSLENL